MTDIQWIYKSFEQLSLQELYDMGYLRQEVFVVEQDCPYLDFDGKDQQAFHLMAYRADKLVGYLRIFDIGGYNYPDDLSIGRVVTSPSVRGEGVGKLLMQKGIEHCKEQFGPQSIRISAQTYLLRFYGELGFVSTGKEYLEDGIPHTEMLLSY